MKTSCPAPSGLRIAGLAILTCLAIGCASGLVPSSGPSAGEVEDLERRIVDAEQRARVGEVEVARLKRRIARLEAELEEARNADRRPPLPGVPAAAVPVPPPSIAAEPEIEEIDLELEPILQPSSPATPPSSAPATPPSSAPATPPSSQPVPPGPEAQALYDQGYTFFHQQRYAEAEARFQSYLAQYPNTELSDNAYFWIGECRYARGHYSSALDAFTATVERYPQGNKIGDALLKAGKCLEALGDSEQAEATYREVARRFPGSAAAALARERLADRR